MAYQSVSNVMNDHTSIMSSYVPKKGDDQRSRKGLMIGILAFTLMLGLMFWNPFEAEPIIHRLPLAQDDDITISTVQQ